VIYRTKYQMALGQVRRALANGVRFAWLTFDEGYGGNRFWGGLDALGQNYVAELPTTFRVWTRRPAVRYRRHPRERAMGRPPRYPRLKAKSNPTAEVRHVSPSRVARRIGDLGSSPRLRRVPWQRYRVKDGSKGPEVWEAKTLTVHLKDEQGLPTAPHVLVVARHVLSGEAKFFLSNAPAAPTETLLVVAFSRWRIERMFQDTKGELEMDHFEVRQYRTIQRHLVLNAVSHLFLAEFRLAERGKNPDLTVAQVHAATAALVPIWIRGGRCSRKRAEAICRRLLLTQQQNSRRPQPPTANPTPIARKRRVLERRDRLSTKALVA
jgi:SRSO17 transposase